MSEEAFYPISTAEKMVAAFMDCSLPREEWDHGMHLVIGLYMVAQYGKKAYPEMKKGLLKYNGCFQNEGYHETMTQFWIWAIKKYRGDEKGDIHWTQETLDGIIFDDDLTHRNLWTRYYTKEVMMSEKAKKTWIQPNLLTKSN